MQGIIRVIEKPLGELLSEAGLINQGQLQVVLTEKDIYPDLRIGEILALHSWIEQKTADFFAEDVPKLAQQEDLNLRIGGFFNKAGLLSSEDIYDILGEQEKSGIKFGSTAVLKGLIKQETLDFYLKYFTIDQNKGTHFQYRDEKTLIQKRFTLIDAKQEVINESLSEHYRKALSCFKKSCSTNNKSQKIKYLKRFTHIYFKIEKLKTKHDLSHNNESINQLNQLDKIYMICLAKLQKITDHKKERIVS